MKETSNKINSQDRILYEIKSQGALSAKALGLKLGVTTMGTRQHLAILESAGLVKNTPEESLGRGRPIKYWKLTKLGHQHFPDAHAQITSDLLISIKELLGEAALKKIMHKRTRDTKNHYAQQLGGVKTLRGKLNRLCELRTSEGYMAELVVNQTDFLLLENHCPICTAAETYQGFCESELDTFRELLKDLATVEREDHILKGLQRCSYRIKPHHDS